MAHRRTNSARGLMIPSLSRAVPAPQIVDIESDSDSQFPSPPKSPLRAMFDYSHPLDHQPGRKHRTRATCLALLALVLISAYAFFAAQPTLGSAPRDGSSAHPMSNAFRLAAARLASSKSSSKRPLPQLELSPEQELAAVTSLVTSLANVNVIPAGVDPTKPIDPQLVLDFDTRSPHAREEVDEVVRDVWLRNPVLLYTKTYSSATREVKAILSELNLHPPPTIVEVDQRTDSDILLPLLHRLTSSTSLPILLIGGHPVPSIEAIRDLHNSGELKDLVAAAGAVINGARPEKKKNKKKGQ